MNEPGHVKTARALVGRPFRHRGRGPDVWDCLGELITAFAANGVPLKDRAAYGRNPVADGLRAELIAQFGAPKPGRPGVGDVGAFRFDGDWHHVGIFAWHPEDGCLSLIHAHAQVGKVAEHAFYGSAWESRLVGIFRHPALEDA